MDTLTTVLFPREIDLIEVYLDNYSLDDFNCDPSFQSDFSVSTILLGLFEKLHGDAFREKFRELFVKSNFNARSKVDPLTYMIIVHRALIDEIAHLSIDTLIEIYDEKEEIK